MKPRSLVAGLLIAQAVSLGLTLAYLIIPGSGIFLAAFGSARLPYVYLIVAAAGSAVSIAVNRLQTRFDLHRLAAGATATVAAIAAGCWLLIAEGGRLWAGYIVLTLFAVQLQMGFVFIGAQAGRAFDVQDIKRVFPRIVAGFVFGFMIGGFLARPLLSLLGRAEHLLAVSGSMAMAMTALILATGRAMADPTGPDHQQGANDRPTVPDGLATAQVAARPPPLRSLLAVPLVSSVFAYQVLSAMGTQLVDYLVYDRAAARYRGADELASFVGDFTAVLNLTGLTVLVLVGSAVMARYGLRFGVAANPIAVTGLLIAALGVSAVAGTDSTMLFVLVGVARISDITLADLATRTSVNATFQVLPSHQRLAAQVGVEGAGVPLALGLTAGIILIINAGFDSPTVPVLIATMAVCVLWCWLSVVLFRRYREGTAAAARRRTLDDVHVDLAEPATRDALISLATTGSADDVAAAMDLLAGAGPEGVTDLLVLVSEREPLAVRHAVLGHLVQHHPARANAVASDCVATGDRAMMVDGLRALGRLGTGAEGGQLTAAMNHDDPAIRAVALGAALAGGALGRGEADPAEVLDRLLRSTDEDDRLVAVRALGEAAALTPTIGAVLGHRGGPAAMIVDALADRSPSVRTAAATAAAALGDEEQTEIVRRLIDGEHQERLRAFYRGCAGAAGPETCSVVASRLDRVGRSEVAPAVRFLSGNQYRTSPADPVVNRIIERQATQAEKARRWLHHLADTSPSHDAGSSQDAGSSRDARSSHDADGARLQRALVEELSLAQRHLLETLALVYDHDLMQRIGHLWAGRTDGDRAMATEALDLTLADHHRAPVLAALAELPQGRIGSDVMVVADRLARSADWAEEADWLQATAVKLLKGAWPGHDSSGRAPVPHRYEPLGPITAELLTDTGLIRADPEDASGG